MGLLSFRAFRVALGLMALLGLGLAAAPLFDVLGFESSLATAFLGSLVVGLATAGLGARARTRPVVPSAVDVFAAAVGMAVACGAPPLIVLLANAVRIPNCSFAEGAAFYAVVALPSLLVGGAWGAFVGLAFDRSSRARLAFVSVWVGSLAWSGGRFYETPAVQAYDPFFGWFPGTLYDAVVRVDGALLSYRAGTALEIAVLGLTCAAFGSRAARLRLGRPRVVAAALALLALLARLALHAQGPALHHRTSAQFLSDTLGVRLDGPRCTVVADGAIAPREVARFLEDCEFQLAEVERFFGARGARRVTAFLFRSEAQKGRLLGAAETFIAKPWRHEVYLQVAGFPHPVLEHELAHVVAGAFAQGPFRVAARAGGLWPVPGLIEGAAVAAGWERDELNPHQWSRAMRDAGLAPSPARALGLSFLTGHSGTAYTVAGSFCRFLLERHGRRRFRVAYRTGSLEAAYGRSVRALERDWNRYLDGVVVSSDEAEVARHRFDRPGIFGRECAREVARLSREARRAAEAGDLGRSIRALEALCREDPGDPASTASLFEMRVRAGQAGRARALAARFLADRRAGIVLAGQVEERLADIDWLGGRAEAAAARYADLAEHAASLDERRMRLVKARAARDPVVGPFVRRFLLGNHAEPEPPPLAIETLHALLAARPGSALGQYLLGRQLFNQEDFERAAPRFSRALALGLDDEPVASEARRVLGISLYRIGQVETAGEVFATLAADPLGSIGRRDEARAWMRRCRWAAGPGRRLAAAER